MILAYLLWVLLTGGALANLLLKSDKLEEEKVNLTLKLALAPALGSFLPTFILYLLNLLKIPLQTFSLWAVWAPLGMILLVSQRKFLFTTFLRYKIFWKEQKLWGKLLVILLSLGFFTLAMRVSLHPMWPGDGMSFWGKRALEWSRLQRIDFSPEMLEQMKTWLNYPLYHSVEMLANALALPTYPTAVTMKFFDSLFVIGIFFSALSFFQIFFQRSLLNLIMALMVTFGQRSVLEFLIAGYAEIDICYFLYLAFVLGVVCTKNLFQRRVTFILWGLILGILSVLKNEGLYRMVFILIGFIVFTIFNQGNIKIKKIGWSLISLFVPLILVICLDRFNRPLISHYSHYSQYTSEMIFSVSRILSRIPLALEGLYYSFTTPALKIHKCSWVITLVLGFCSVIYFASRSRLRDYALFLAGLWLINMGFNIAPTLLVVNTVDPRLDQAPDLAALVLGRLNLQVSLFLNSLVVLFLGEKIP